MCRLPLFKGHDKREWRRQKGPIVPKWTGKSVAIYLNIEKDIVSLEQFSFSIAFLYASLGIWHSAYRCCIHCSAVDNLTRFQCECEVKNSPKTRIEMLCLLNAHGVGIRHTHTIRATFNVYRLLSMRRIEYESLERRASRTLFTSKDSWENTMHLNFTRIFIESTDGVSVLMCRVRTRVYPRLSIHTIVCK